jgi:sulfoxide reductase heme-binding subunit YedZ
MGMTSAGLSLQRPASKSWRPFFLLAAIVVVISALTVAEGRFSVESVRQAVRLTAQMSLLLFSAAFSASALARLWPNAFTRFMRGYRRQFGLAFAFSHGVHALALFAFAEISPAQFQEATDLAMYIFGGLAYLFIAAMAMTSFDRTAAWIGPGAWRLLHTIGGYDIWLTFLVAEGKRAAHSAYYWPYVALLIGAMAVRLAATAMRARTAVAAGG